MNQAVAEVSQCFWKAHGFGKGTASAVPIEMHERGL